MMICKDSFRYYCRRKGYTQRELAHQLNVDASTLSKWINGRNPWPKDAIIRICELLELDETEQAKLFASPQQDWGDPPDGRVFNNRPAELDELRQSFIIELCQLVGVLGTDDSDKTILAKKLASQIQDQFEDIIWRLLRHTPPIEDILDEYIRFMPGYQKGNLPTQANRHKTSLIAYLHQHRCWLVLVNVEAILKEGKSVSYYRNGYRD